MQLASVAHAQDAGVALPVRSATLHPEDAPLTSLEVGRGVFLPEPLAVAIATERRACMAEGPKPAAGNTTTPAALAVAFVAGVVVGGVAVGWVAVKLSARP